jgi:hypothetical protein
VGEVEEDATNEGVSSTQGKRPWQRRKQNQRKKTLEDHKYTLGGSSKSTYEFSEATRYLLNFIGTTFTHGNEVETALEERKELDFDALMPVKKISKASDAATKLLEDESFEAVFKAKFNNMSNVKMLTMII